MTAYEVWVACPNCNWKQKIPHIQKSKLCVRCGTRFLIFPKNSRSRVVFVNGDFQAYLADVRRLLRGHKHRQD